MCVYFARVDALYPNTPGTRDTHMLLKFLFTIAKIRFAVSYVNVSDILSGNVQYCVGLQNISNTKM